jgi:biofilm protein TabA
MIIDQLENWENYHFGKEWKLAFDFLMSLTPDSEEKKYTIQGDDIFAQVMSYDTKTRDEAVLEAHRKYADIQMVITGSEAIEWTPQTGLVVDKAYDKSKDVEFYKPNNSGQVRINVLPKTFVMLLPEDAHMPCLIPENKAKFVKKVVIKINVDLLKAKPN